MPENPSRRLLLAGVVLATGVGHGVLACRAPQVLPARKDVNQVVVEEYAPSAVKPQRVISDAPSIDRVFAVLGAHDGAWSKPFGTFPATRCTVYFRRGKDSLAMLFLGAGWIGGCRYGERSSDIRIQNLSRQELDEIEGAIGVPLGSCTKW
jgi:hypothetical protein